MCMMHGGRPISCSGTMTNTLGKINPFRYRGYVYDEETCLYYLTSRYYNPYCSIFCNADSLIGDNLFEYCSNSPICITDHMGQNGTPQVNLYGYNDLKTRLKIPATDPSQRMTNVEFAWGIRQMEHDGWKYDKRGDSLGMRYGYVDCVSVYRYTMKWYYWGYSEYVPSGVDSVPEMIKYCCTPLEPIEDDYSNLEIGMALFMKDSNGAYTHVGYYVGCGKVLESNYITNNGKTVVFGVRIIDLEGSAFSECAYLHGIDYVDIDEEDFLCQDFGQQ